MFLLFTFEYSIKTVLIAFSEFILFTSKRPLTVRIYKINVYFYETFKILRYLNWQRRNIVSFQRVFAISFKFYLNS